MLNYIDVIILIIPAIASALTLLTRSLSEHAHGFSCVSTLVHFSYSKFNNFRDRRRCASKVRIFIYRTIGAQ